MNEAVRSYPVSIIIGCLCILFSIFVITLFGFHTFLIGLNLTTQEKLNHKFDWLGSSPYTYGSACKNWIKVIICPRKKSETRVSWPLYLKSNDE